MNRYQLTHVTDFLYDGPVSESYNEVRLRPIHDDKQTCVSFRLTTNPNSRGTAYLDAFGNWVHQFNILSAHRHLQVEAKCVVLAHDAAAFPTDHTTLAELDARREELHDEYFDFVSPTAYVPHLPGLTELIQTAELASGGTAAGFAQAASDLIHERFRYVKGATHVNSSIADSLAGGAGVCQDFAHLLLGVARMRGLPGRYVSGYMVPENSDGTDARLEEVIGGQASHAWAEVYLPQAGWSGLDPTLGKPVSLRHVRVAYGRDYNDVAPVRGIYRGESGQRLSVDVRMRPELNDEGHEQLNHVPEIELEEAVVNERPQQPAQQQQHQQAQQQQ